LFFFDSVRVTICLVKSVSLIRHGWRKKKRVAIKFCFKAGLSATETLVLCKFSQNPSVSADIIQDVPKENVNIQRGYSIGHPKQKKKKHTCPIPDGFRGTAISLYKSLDLAPNIVLHCRRTAPLYEACESA
jgi:hypothetical protein